MSDSGDSPSDKFADFFEVSRMRLWYPPTYEQRREVAGVKSSARPQPKINGIKQVFGSERGLMKVKTFIRHDCTEDCDVRYYEDGWYLVSRSYCLPIDEFVERKAKISFCPLCGKLLPLLAYDATEVEQKTAGTTVEDFKKALKNWADSSAIFTGDGSWTTTTQ